MQIFSIFFIFVLLDKISQLREKGDKNAIFVSKKFGYIKYILYLCSQFTLGLPKKGLNLSPKNAFKTFLYNHLIYR